MRRCLVLLLALGCGTAQPVGPIPPVSSVPAPAASPTQSQPAGEPASGEEAAIASLADGLERRARELEPAVTSTLASMAEAAGGSMVGLEHRFKTRSSLERKIRLRLSEDSERRVDAVVIDDALRYTMRIDDVPAGNYDRTAHAVLAKLEGQGHQVVKVKNYWPRGDNYSGVNAVLRGPNGLEWELQFHTTASLEAQKEGHLLYEEMRKIDTPPARKRELFDKLAAPWDNIAIPAGVLEPHSLHATEKIIRRDPPQ